MILVKKLDYYEAWYEDIFKKNEIFTMPGETRYFKCSEKCGKEVNRIEVSHLVLVIAGFEFSLIETYKAIS